MEMHEHQQILYKQELKEKCISVIRERISVIKNLMANAQAAANNETKSSAGDKYETSRAMGQLEKDMFASQLNQTMLELSAASSIDCSKVYNDIRPGCLVNCGDKKYFMIAGLNKLTLNGEVIMPVSPLAPLSKTLMGKKAGDKIEFNQQLITIVHVF